MATQTSGRPLAPPASTNGTRQRQPPSGRGNAGVASVKRSVPMALAGATAVVVGAVAALLIYTNLDHRQMVLAVNHPVAPGGVIAATDLYQVRVAPATGIKPIPVAQAASLVVGKTAKVQLVPGTLLSIDQIGTPSTVQAGQAIVGLALKPGQAPAVLRPGTHVEVIDTTKATTPGEQPKPVVLTTSAVVAPDDTDAKARPTAGNGTMLVSLSMPAGDAPAVAAAAMDGRVSLVVLP